MSQHRRRPHTNARRQTPGNPDMDRAEDGMSRWKSRGIRRLICAIGFSINGLRFAFRSEAAFRQELAALLVLVPLALWLRDSAVERALLIGSLFLVIITELLNTAIEAVVDRVGEERHNLSAHAKDVGSAAVFVAIANAVIVWCLVLI